MSHHITNQTARDASERIRKASVGWLGFKPTGEYLRQLIIELDDWKYRVQSELHAAWCRDGGKDSLNFKTSDKEPDRYI